MCLALALVTTSTALPTSPNEIVVGNVRVQVLSRTLIRLEPKGPMGFEDRPTLMVRARNFSVNPDALAISVKNVTATATWLQTTHHLIRLPKLNCSAMAGSTDGKARVNTQARPAGVNVTSATACCAVCGTDISCRGFVFHSGSANPRGDDEEKPKPPANNCELLADWTGTEHRGGFALCAGQPAAVYSRDDSGTTATLVWSSSVGVVRNTVHWPSPGSATRALAIADRPRVAVPEWGPMPIPDKAKV